MIFLGSVKIYNDDLNGQMRISLLLRDLPGRFGKFPNGAVIYSIFLIWWQYLDQGKVLIRWVYRLLNVWILWIHTSTVHTFTTPVIILFLSLSYDTTWQSYEQNSIYSKSTSSKIHIVMTNGDCYTLNIITSYWNLLYFPVETWAPRSHFECKMQGQYQLGCISWVWRRPLDCFLAVQVLMLQVVLMMQEALM